MESFDDFYHLILKAKEDEDLLFTKNLVDIGHEALVSDKAVFVFETGSVLSSYQKRWRGGYSCLSFDMGADSSSDGKTWGERSLRLSTITVQ